MNPDLVAQLFSTYYNDALLYAMSFTKDVSQAEDIAQDAFYKALKSADDSISNFKAWLLCVCRNMFFNSRRKAARLTVLDDDLADERDEVLGKIIKDENYRSLYHAIGLLPDNLKEVIVLFYFQDMRVSEIANIVGKSENNVKVMLFRGREQIKKILEN